MLTSFRYLKSKTIDYYQGIKSFLFILKLDLTQDIGGDFDVNTRSLESRIPVALYFKIPAIIVEYGVNLLLIFLTSQQEVVFFLPQKILLKSVIYLLTPIFKILSWCGRYPKKKYNNRKSTLCNDIGSYMLLIGTCIFVSSFNYSKIYHILRGGSLKLFAMFKIGIFFDRYLFGIQNHIATKKWLEISRSNNFLSKLSIFIQLTQINIISVIVYLFQLICFHILMNSDTTIFWVINVLSRIKFFNFKVSSRKTKDKRVIFDYNVVDASLREIYKNIFFIGMILLMPGNQTSDYQWKISSIIFLDFIMIILQGIYGVIQYEDSLRNLNDSIHRIYNFFYQNYSKNKKNDVEKWYIPKSSNELMLFTINYPNPYQKLSIILNFQFFSLTSLVAVVYPIIRQNEQLINLWESQENHLQSIFIIILVQKFLTTINTYRMIKSSPISCVSPTSTTHRKSSNISYIQVDNHLRLETNEAYKRRIGNRQKNIEENVNYFSDNINTKTKDYSKGNKLFEKTQTFGEDNENTDKDVLEKDTYLERKDVKIKALKSIIIEDNFDHKLNNDETSPSYDGNDIYQKNSSTEIYSPQLKAAKLNYNIELIKSIDSSSIQDTNKSVTNNQYLKEISKTSQSINETITLAFKNDSEVISNNKDFYNVAIPGTSSPFKHSAFSFSKDYYKNPYFFGKSNNSIGKNSQESYNENDVSPKINVRKLTCDFASPPDEKIKTHVSEENLKKKLFTVIKEVPDSERQTEEINLDLLLGNDGEEYNQYSIKTGSENDIKKDDKAKKKMKKKRNRKAK